jgi:hypothetical protein
VPKKYPPAVRAVAVDLVRRGVSLADAAEGADAHASTVMRWCRAAGVTPANATPPVPPPRVEAPAPVEDDEPEDEGGDTLERTRRMQRQLERSARLAARDHNHTAAQRYMRDAANLSAVIARLEKIAAEDDGALHIPRAEIDQARDVVRERFAAIAARGDLRCADCARKLTISFGDDIGKDAGT